MPVAAAALRLLLVALLGVGLAVPFGLAVVAMAYGTRVFRRRSA